MYRMTGWCLCGRRSLVAAFAFCAMLTQQEATSADVEVIQLSYDDNRYVLKLEAHIAATPAAVFAVITDYPSIPRLHRRVKESRVLRRTDEQTSDVFTLIKGCIAFVFCKSVRRVERIVENPPVELIATIVPEQSDFLFGRVRWLLTAEKGGTLLTYENETEPKFGVPGMLGEALMARWLGRTARQMIERVEDQARIKEEGS